MGKYGLAVKKEPSVPTRERASTINPTIFWAALYDEFPHIIWAILSHSYVRHSGL